NDVPKLCLISPQDYLGKYRVWAKDAESVRSRKMKIKNKKAKVKRRKNTKANLTVKSAYTLVIFTF
ncbi:MAG: hypothetical protein ACRC8K_13880, partial [Waterburya sp.]